MVSSRPSLRLPGVGLRRAGGGAGLGQAGAQGGGGRAGAGWGAPAGRLETPTVTTPRAGAGRPGPGAVAFTAGLSVLALVAVVLRTCETFFFFFFEDSGCWHGGCFTFEFRVWVCIQLAILCFEFPGGYMLKQLSSPSFLPYPSELILDPNVY